jgi:hypothetical protein
MASTKELAITLRLVATSGMKPKALIAAVRERYPEATKKEVVRAAFYTVTDNEDINPEYLEALHSFAITELAVDEDEPEKSGKLRKKKKDRKTAREAQATQ